jgi:multidrug resistance efflux pump
VTLQKYRNALDDAELNLGWTKVYAQADGTVSNLQLSPGFMPRQAQPRWRW